MKRDLCERAALPAAKLGGKISKRGNRYLRVLFVQAAWVVWLKPKIWERHGLRPWIEAAKGGADFRWSTMPCHVLTS